MESTSNMPAKKIQMSSHPNIMCIVHNNDEEDSVSDPQTGESHSFTELAIRNEGFMPLPLIGDQPICFQEILEKSATEKGNATKSQLVAIGLETNSCQNG